LSITFYDVTIITSALIFCRELRIKTKR